ncbi:sugar porter family MFS transporter [Paucibacter sp. B2R-40]|uniref:sugar porter family MFS transporter n=1 Tax=Paucibacter sp. B2R-40 TaxID=2893554 RepID=UPI0021E37791|nr:sugar porter family MFS transporter [Paucibacter sp. B2R-40]MCV2353496.1 sugar porter family MFS transporter [Paucibacter sp. B2R-40]
MNAPAFASLKAATDSPKVWPMRFMLFIAGMGGLLYGIDIGIIAGALPYLESTASVTWRLSAQQLGFIVAAVLLGSVLSSLFAGALADWVGRKKVMVLSGLLFTLSIPIIALADGYTPLLLGRLLQGISGGLIGVVVPLYLAECLNADKRGRGTAMFQLLLTIGLVVAALIGLYYARSVEAVAGSGGEALFAAKDQAWRSIFWICLGPGLVFTLGCLFLSESPRWLVGRGRPLDIDQARTALLRSRSAAAAEQELREMQQAAAATGMAGATGSVKGPEAAAREPLFSRRYRAPFLLACVILACTQATGINSILAYVVNILNQAGLSGSVANSADVAIKVLNALMTVVALLLVDRKGRKFLLMLGSGGIFVALVLAGSLFWSAERGRIDVTPALQQLVQQDRLQLSFDSASLAQLGVSADGAPQQLTLSYAYGDFSNVQSRRSDELDARPIEISREHTVQSDSVIGAFFRRLHLNPFADPGSAAGAPLVITQALVGPVPSATHGWLVTACIFAFVAFFAVGPGVCVWLALSELMPTRIRSNGMSIALLINQFVSTTIAAVFLPTVGNHGYAAMFFFWAGCTVVYFLVAALILPETKGKTLEQIEAHFARKP